MAPRRKSVEEGPPKKERLTLAQLASYDDIITDALIDHVYYWTEIRKNRLKYSPSRGISEDEISTILRDSVVVEKDPAKAEAQLLKLSGIRKFSERLRTKKEKDDFRAHVRKYINIYLPDCVFEVNTVNRFTVVSHEAAITARKVIAKGQAIKYLSGIQVSLTPDEELDLGSRRRDFSIVMSSRRKNASIFLGPARFANHDCNANAKLVTSGVNGMEVVAVREIAIGDEITVTYGADYFGEDNGECLCVSCEKGRRNGWSEKESTSEENDNTERTRLLQIAEEDLSQGPYLFRRKRKRTSETESRTPSMTPDWREAPVLKRRKIEGLKKRAFTNLIAEPELASDNCDSPDVPEEPISSQMSQVEQQPVTCQRSSTLSRETQPEPQESYASTYLVIRQETFEEKPEDHEFNSLTRTSVLATNDRVDDPAKDALSVQNHLLQPRISELPLHVHEDITHQSSRPSSQVSSSFTNREASPNGIEVFSSSNQGSTEATSDSAGSPKLATDMEVDQHADPSSSPKEDADGRESKTDRILPSLEIPTDTVREDTIAIGDPDLSQAEGPTELSDFAPTRRRKTKRSFPLPDPSLHTPQQRIPGDYVLTASLLTSVYSAWVCCLNCDNPFVQNEAYYTRIGCPRCERHSKLYGYQWPKTDREGKNDNEERVMDHRTVHRFIRPSAEREIKKAKVRVLGKFITQGEDGVEVSETQKRPVGRPKSKISSVSTSSRATTVRKSAARNYIVKQARKKPTKTINSQPKPVRKVRARPMIKTRTGRLVARPAKYGGEFETEEPKRRIGRPPKQKLEKQSTPKKRMGRPPKQRVEEPQPTKKRMGRPPKHRPELEKKRIGRPPKHRQENESASKKRVGRPPKVRREAESTVPKKRVGRPPNWLKEMQRASQAPRKRVGRPPKRLAASDAPAAKKRIGRPPKRLMEAQISAPKKPVGRPKRLVEPISTAVAPKKRVGRPPKRLTQPETLTPRKRIGRPPKRLAEADKGPITSRKRIGRPPKRLLELPAQPPPKKRMGRPPKKQVAPLQPAKRPVGRPPKKSNEPVKRPVGRPPKHLAAAARQVGRPPSRRLKVRTMSNRVVKTPTRYASEQAVKATSGGSRPRIGRPPKKTQKIAQTAPVKRLGRPPKVLKRPVGRPPGVKRGPGRPPGKKSIWDM